MTHTARTPEPKTVRLPQEWLCLLRRLLALPRGQRYQIILTVDDGLDWSVLSLGKVERIEGKS